MNENTETKKMSKGQVRDLLLASAKDMEITGLVQDLCDAVNDIFHEEWNDISPKCDYDEMADNAMWKYSVAKKWYDIFFDRIADAIESPARKVRRENAQDSPCDFNGFWLTD